MAFNHKNETPEQRRKRVEADMQAREEARKRNAGTIRCYGGQGFIYEEKQPDGTVKKRYNYGREGD